MALIDFLTGPAEEENEEYTEETKTAVSAPQAAVSSSIGLFEPKAFDEATAIAEYVKKGNVVTVNLHRLSKEYSQRTIDFLTGVVYALDGRIEKIGHNLILCSPANVRVSGRITMSAE
ncbi:MAG: cell division protein SepF [Solobacterium sp.]|nr:cell division protein SepF [Solobacterium sp.]MBQ9823500.1 cell division protein SepF [Solobacterium sp.]